mgnify:CR=1 FL=1
MWHRITKILYLYHPSVHPDPNYTIHNENVFQSQRVCGPALAAAVGRPPPPRARAVLRKPKLLRTNLAMPVWLKQHWMAVFAITIFFALGSLRLNAQFTDDGARYFPDSDCQSQNCNLVVNGGFECNGAQDYQPLPEIPYFTYLDCASPTPQISPTSTTALGWQWLCGSTPGPTINNRCPTDWLL